MTSARRSTYGFAGALVVLALLVRLPALLNASGTNSDAAIVGLQARHILHGEWSPFLWGSGYQTSADSTWAALLFRVFGSSALVLMLSALVLYVALTIFAFCMLRRRLAPGGAFVATLPLVFTTACIHSYALYPPRQLSITLAFAALLSIDGATLVSLAIGGALALLAVAADPYASIFLPAELVLAVATVLRARDGLGARARAMGAFYGGVVPGAFVLALLLGRPGAQQGVASMSPRVLGHNASLFWHECLPWVVGTKIYKPLHVMDYVAWKMPLAYSVVAWIGVAALVVALASSIVLAVRAKSGLAAIGWLTIVLNVASFFLSRMVMDHFSMRYLAASVLVLPFVLEPLVARLGAPRFVAMLAPYLFVAGAGGWLSHGPWVRGPVPVRTDAGRGVVEARVLRALQERNVQAAIADYWAAYRLDFLWREAIPVAPYHASQDRYPPYRRKLSAAKRIAYIHDRDRSFEDEPAAEREIAAEGKVADRFTWEGFDVVVVDRK